MPSRLESRSFKPLFVVDETENCNGSHGAWTLPVAAVDIGFPPPKLLLGKTETLLNCEDVSTVPELFEAITMLITGLADVKVLFNPALKSLLVIQAISVTAPCDLSGIPSPFKSPVIAVEFPVAVFAKFAKFVSTVSGIPSRSNKSLRLNESENGTESTVILKISVVSVMFFEVFGV